MSDDLGVVPDWVGKVADAIKSLGLATIAAAIAIVSAACLWLPDKQLESVRMLKFRDAHPDWFGPAFWLSVIVLGLRGFAVAKDHFVGHRDQFDWNRYFQERLEQLTPDEKAILWEYIKRQQRAIELPSEDGSVMSLANARVIWRPQQIVQPRINYNSDGAPMTYPMVFHINEIVWKILREKPDLLS